MNSPAGTIAGVNAVFGKLATTVTNHGHISGGTDGVVLAAGGSVANGVGASISGGSIGVLVSGGSAKITDSGTISGGSIAVQFSGGGTDRLILEPGAVINGTVSAGSATSTLELASGASAGSVGGLGTRFAGFKSIVVERGRAGWRAGRTASLPRPA